MILSKLYLLSVSLILTLGQKSKCQNLWKFTLLNSKLKYEVRILWFLRHFKINFYPERLYDTFQIFETEIN